MKSGHGKVYSWCELPGFGFDSIIGRNFLNPVSFLKMTEHGSIWGLVTFWNDVLRGGEMPDAAIYLAWKQVEVTADLRDRLERIHASNSWDDMFKFLHRELKLFLRYHPIGNSSQKYDGILLDKDGSLPLLHCTVKRVIVNKSTRRPTPFPQFVKKHFEKKRDDDFIHTDSKMAEKCTRKVDIPVGVKIFMSKSRCLPTQLDWNDHLNEAEYAGVCFNALAEALSAQFFKSVKGLIWRYIVRRMSFLYLKEASEGDDLTTLIWHRETEGLVFCFHVTREGDVLCQAEFEFFPARQNISSKL